MRDFDRILTNALPEELENVPPAPVDKRAVRDRTFQKLGLERPSKLSPFQGETGQAEAVTKRRHPWAVAAAVALALTAAVMLGTILRPVLVAPAGQGEGTPARGTYFELETAEAAFDGEAQALVFTLDAQTDMDLDHTDCQSLYAFDYTITFHGESGDYQYPYYQGESRDALAHWTQTGENAYRCEGFSVPVDTALLEEQGISGVASGTLNLTATDTAYAGSSDPWQFFPAADFTVDLNPVTDAAPGPATYFEASAADVTFDEDQWAVVVTLEARTDMDLDSAAAQQLYAWHYSLYLRTPPGGDMDIGQYDGDSLDALAQWTQTGEDTYQSAPVAIPIPLSFQEEYDLSGDVPATLSLVATDLTLGDENPTQFFPEIGFTVTLPDPSEYSDPAPGTYLQSLDATLPYVYYDQGLGILHLQAALETDMELNHPHAGDYYSWEAQLSLTAPDGRQLTLTPMPDTPGENPQAQPTWSLEETSDGRSYYLNKDPLSSGFTTFAFAITNTALPEEPNYQEEYALYGSLDGVLTLTCHETTAGGAAKDWEVEIPFTAVLPDPNSTASMGVIGSADGPTVAYTTP